MCCNVNLCFRKRNDFSLKKRVLREIHQVTSITYIGPTLTEELYLIRSGVFSAETRICFVNPCEVKGILSIQQIQHYALVLEFISATRQWFIKLSSFYSS